MSAVDQPAPSLDISEWVQGPPSNISNETGKVILIEVFQVNCPGCFIGGLPEVIQVHEQFKNEPMVIWGLATAFEDFQLNNLENLKRLLTTGEVVGETFNYLLDRGMLRGSSLDYQIPFPVAWDKVVKRSGGSNEAEVLTFIKRDFPNYEELPNNAQVLIKQQISNYLANKQYDAKTFDKYALRGTPSSIIIDKKGILRHKLFGSGLGLTEIITPLLNE